MARQTLREKFLAAFEASGWATRDGVKQRSGRYVTLRSNCHQFKAGKLMERTK